jgi:hypothetical protein
MTQTNRKISPYWVGTINTVEIAIQPKAIYRFSAIYTKISMPFLREIVKIMLK